MWLFSLGQFLYTLQEEKGRDQKDFISEKGGNKTIKYACYVSNEPPVSNKRKASCFPSDSCYLCLSRGIICTMLVVKKKKILPGWKKEALL